ncbi:MAG: ferritin family protein [Candidatus Methanoperedens sp.]
MINTENQINILDILKEAISIEIYGQEYYSIFSDIVEEENGKSIFRRLSRDEGDHKQLLEKEYRQISGKPIEEGVMDEKNREQARRVFPESLEPMTITETQEALKIGIRTEERSIELYSNSAQETGIRSSKDLFLKLVIFEKGHKEILEAALYHLGQEGSWYGYSPPTIKG